MFGPIIFTYSDNSGGHEPNMEKMKLKTKLNNPQWANSLEVMRRPKVKIKTGQSLHIFQG